MQDESNGSSGAPISDSVIQSEIETNVSDVKNSVQYETYKKTLGQAKKFKEQAENFQAKLLELEQGKLEADGKKDQLITSLRTQNRELDSKLKGAVGSFASSKGMSAIVSEAVKAGCTQTKLLEKLVQEKIGDLDFDEAFNPDMEQVKLLVDEARNEAPVLFSKPGPAVANHTLKSSTDSIAAGKKVTLKNAKDEDLMAMWEQAQVHGR